MLVMTFICFLVCVECFSFFLKNIIRAGDEMFEAGYDLELDSASK